MTATAVLELLLNPGTFTSWDQPIPPAQDSAYRAELAAAQCRSGVDESISTGTGHVAGQPIAVICSEFAFLGGTIGGAAADRIVAAVRRATSERLPLLALPASGGTRVQEALLRSSGWQTSPRRS